MTISVILPCLKRDDAVERLITNITQQAQGSVVKLDLIVIEGISPCAKARNVALSRSTGDYIAWIDADDEISPDWWRSIADAISSDPDVVIFPWLDEECSTTLSCSDKAAENGDKLLSAVLRDAAPRSYLWNKVIRRKFWLDKQFNESYLLLSDFDIIPDVLKDVRSVRKLHKPLYRYRYEPNSVCRKNFETRDCQLFEIMIKRLYEWKDTPYKDDPIVPLAKQISYRLVKLLNLGKPPASDHLLAQSARALKGHISALLFCRDLWIGDKIRALCVSLGQNWLFKAVHAIHRLCSR